MQQLKFWITKQIPRSEPFAPSHTTRGFSKLAKAAQVVIIVSATGRGHGPSL